MSTPVGYFKPNPGFSCHGNSKITPIPPFKNYIIIYPAHEAYMGCPRGVMVKAMDRGILVPEFVLQSRHYVHIRANTLEKGINSRQLWVK